MNPIGPNGYNFRHLIPSDYTGPVGYVFRPEQQSPVGHFRNTRFYVVYGHIAGCPSTGPTGPVFDIETNHTFRDGPAGPPSGSW